MWSRAYSLAFLEGLWSLLTLRDFADLGGTTSHGLDSPV